MTRRQVYAFLASTVLLSLPSLATLSGFYGIYLDPSLAREVGRLVDDFGNQHGLMPTAMLEIVRVEAEEDSLTVELSYQHVRPDRVCPRYRIILTRTAEGVRDNFTEVLRRGPC